ncbi:MAG: ATP-binding protein [Deltaproteobacteria bacterium]|nr:ATP-binding protein [Deltaproteobacteria bacterium]
MSPSLPPGSTGWSVVRRLDLAARVARKSCFLFGPRQTGKSHLLRRTLPGVRVYDLLDSQVFLDLSARPGRLAEELASGERLVVLDEIQRLPGLLHEVHRLIEERGVRFLLTGSSPRKLRRGGVDLLGGRARTLRLHPLSAVELGSDFDLDRALDRGLLPAHWHSDDPDADLGAYVGSYLEQEIVAEAATRNLPAFSRFLRVAALCSGTIVNFTGVAGDAQVPRTTVYEYFGILRDTLLLHELPAWRESVKRKPIASSKYYFFDVGVARVLQGRRHARGTPEYGLAFETWLMHELTCWRDYRSGDPLAYWRSTSGFEVDFILDDHTAVEAKATANVAGRDLRSLRALREERRLRRYLCVSLEPRRRVVDGITILPWREFLEELWAGRYR